MRGRKPKPTRLKVINGNPGKRPLNLDGPIPEAAIPPTGTDPRGSGPNGTALPANSVSPGS